MALSNIYFPPNDLRYSFLGFKAHRALLTFFFLMLFGIIRPKACQILLIKRRFGQYIVQFLRQSQCNFSIYTVVYKHIIYSYFNDFYVFILILVIVHFIIFFAFFMFPFRFIFQFNLAVLAYCILVSFHGNISFIHFISAFSFN